MCNKCCTTQFLFSEMIHFWSNNKIKQKLNKYKFKTFVYHFDIDQTDYCDVTLTETDDSGIDSYLK